MKTSQCQCGNRIFFENTQCQNCNSELGFLADEGVLSSVFSVNDNYWKAAHNQRAYRKCDNYLKKTSCNWMIPDSDPQIFCLSCRLSEVIPDLSKPENIERWNRIESAKRRLIYSLFWLGLPLVDKSVDPEKGLSFHLMEDREHFSEFVVNPAENSKVVTGHQDGTITLNIEEADHVLREEIRTRMQERYRTLLGHFRHESGHYYWYILVQNSDLLDEFRQHFGDERENYSDALQRYYNNGPREGWQSNWVSAYASAHPWEDWAECWAHYLHMVDTMETVYDFAENIYQAKSEIKNQQFSKQYLQSITFNQLVDEWSRLAVFINEMTRSLGLVDAYPFVLSDVLVKKMRFIHKVITHERN